MKKVYGPYKHPKRGRQYVIIHDNGTRRSTSFARWLYEEVHKVKVPSHLHVDHIDGDMYNNAIENLQLLTKGENSKKSFLENPKRRKQYKKFYCKVCKEYKSMPLYKYKIRKKTNRFGITCSRSCASKLVRKKQLEGIIPTNGKASNDRKRKSTSEV